MGIHPDTLAKIAYVTIEQLPPVELHPGDPMYGVPQRTEYHVQYFSASGKKLVGSITKDLTTANQFPIKDKP